MIGADATDLDQLAEALREDRVVIDRVMGSGEAQESHDRIAELVREVPFPVYVALVEEVEGMPDTSSGDVNEQVATLLHRRLGGSGLYLVQTAGGPMRATGFGLDADSNRLTSGFYAVGDALEEAIPESTRVPAVVEAEATVRAAEDLVEHARGEDDLPDGASPLAGDDLEELGERAEVLGVRAEWRPSSKDFIEVREASTGFSVLMGGLAALVIALLAGQSLRGWPRAGRGQGAARGAGGPTVPDVETERKRAGELLDGLAAALAATDWSQVADLEVAERARTARVAAEPLLDSSDPVDLIGAQVLARAGSTDLTRGTRGKGAPLTTCFFDPRHSQGRSRVSWRLGDGHVEVPCCRRCEKAVDRGRTPEQLHVRHGWRRRAVPYWSRGDVWARTGLGSTTDFLARDVLADRGGAS